MYDFNAGHVEYRRAEQVIEVAAQTQYLRIYVVGQLDNALRMRGVEAPGTETGCQHVGATHIDALEAAEAGHPRSRIVICSTWR